MAEIIFKGSQLKITPEGMKTDNKPAKLGDVLRKSAGSKSYDSLGSLLKDVEKKLRNTK